MLAIKSVRLYNQIYESKLPFIPTTKNRLAAR